MNYNSLIKSERKTALGEFIWIWFAKRSNVGFGTVSLIVEFEVKKVYREVGCDE